MTGLSAEQLDFRYPDGTSVLAALTLTIARGEMVVILGANGSGKSTLLRLLAGLMRPTSGSITVEGAPIAHARDRVGLVFQNPDHQMITPSVTEELALGLELRGLPVGDIREHVEETLQRFDLMDLRAQSPEALSGGQKQRVALAAIMVMRPDYLLFDEPDSLLDAPARSEFMRSVDLLRPACGILWTCPHPKRMPTSDRLFELAEGTLHARA